jgi:hypothetical protein
MSHSISTLVTFCDFEVLKMTQHFFCPLNDDATRGQIWNIAVEHLYHSQPVRFSNIGPVEVERAFWIPVKAARFSASSMEEHKWSLVKPEKTTPLR